MSSYVWEEINFSIQNFDSCIVEVLDYMINLTPYIIINVIT